MGSFNAEVSLGNRQEESVTVTISRDANIFTLKTLLREAHTRRCKRHDAYVMSNLDYLNEIRHMKVVPVIEGSLDGHMSTAKIGTCYGDVSVVECFGCRG